MFPQPKKRPSFITLNGILFTAYVLSVLFFLHLPLQNLPWKITYKSSVPKVATLKNSTLIPWNLNQSATLRLSSRPEYSKNNWSKLKRYLTPKLFFFQVSLRSSSNLQSDMVLNLSIVISDRLK